VASPKQKHHYQTHLPVLLEATLKCLQPQVGDSYLDLTAGYGGHASAVIAATAAAEKAVLVDRDPEAVAALKKRFAIQVRIIQKSFAEATQLLLAEGKLYDMVLMDLGVSSPQLNKVERGFSLRQAARLDMRMDQTQKLTAYEVVNSYAQKALAQVIALYGEERQANAIAQAIVRHRPVLSTRDLARIVASVIRRKSKIHPATRSFQAIRIEVNDELGQLKSALPRALQLLAPGGRIAVISFHSLEDRIVKEVLFEAGYSGYEATIKLLNKKPMLGRIIEPTNPHARSAILRAAVKNKNKHTPKGGAYVNRHT